MRICSLSGDCSRLMRLFLLVCLFAVGCGGTETAKKNGRENENKNTDPTTVPLQLSRDRLPLIKVRVNDNAPVPFLLYPSADQSIVFREYANRWNLTKKNRNSSSESGGRIVKGSVRKVSVGSVSARRVSVRIIPRDEFSMLRRRVGEELEKIGGILGYSFFKRFEVVFNYPAKTFTIRHAKKLRFREGEGISGLKPPKKRGQIRFSITGGPQNRRYVTFQTGVNGKYRIRFAIDPTMPINLMSETVVKKYNFKRLTGSEKEERFGPRAKNQEFVDLDRIWISGIVVKNNTFKVVHGMSSVIGAETAGILGYVFMKNLRIRIHFPKRRLDIKPVK